MRRLALCVCILAASGALACELLGFTTGSSSPSASSTGGTSAADEERAAYAAQAAAREQEEQDKTTAAEVERQRLTAETEKTPETIMAFTDAVFSAYAEGAVDRGLVNGPNNLAAARALVDEALPGAGEEHVGPLRLTSARLAAMAGEYDVAIVGYEASLAANPSFELFAELSSLPSSPEVDAGILRSCGGARSTVGQADLFSFVDLCLARAGGKRSALKWKGARADLKAYDAELKRFAEEERLAAEQARLAAEEAALAAEEAAKEAEKGMLFVTAAVFAAGDCDFGDCAGNGWTTRTDAGTVKSTCSFGKCLEDGWETRFPDGTTARTSCNFGKCLEDGWETRFADGSTARTSCSFGKCAEDGWETRLPDGSSARTSCNFSKCFTDGWETRLPDGASVRCDCKFDDCLGNGTECR